MKHAIYGIVLSLSICLFSCAHKAQNSTPHEVTSPRYEVADSVINAAVACSNIPGAVLAIVEDTDLVYLKAYGYRQVFPDTLPMTLDTQFDLASLSKIVGTGFSMMTLIQDGKVDLDAPIRTYLPEYQTEATVRDYMTHVSGMPAYASYTQLLADYPEADNALRKDLLYQHMATLERLAAPGEDCVYSCLNFISLQHVIEHVTHQSLADYATERVWQPLGMTHTCYYPLCHTNGACWPSLATKADAANNPIVAPTERIGESDSCYLRVVHDPLAREMMSGISGNAGVFSTASDLALLVKWMLATLDSTNTSAPRVLDPTTLCTMMTVPAGYEQFGRALAWDVMSDYAGCKGHFASEQAVCHTGYTGTCMVVDPLKRKAYILLTNRAHPSDGGATSALRKAVADIVFGE